MYQILFPNAMPLFVHIVNKCYVTVVFCRTLDSWIRNDRAFDTPLGDLISPGSLYCIDEVTFVAGITTISFIIVQMSDRSFF